MPVFGLGTWMMGGDKNYNPKNNDKADILAIENAIEAGITHIDTAQNYAAGHAEKLVGTAIKGYRRSSLFITTKLDKSNLKYEDVLSSALGSLERMALSYIDLLLIHSPNPEVSIKETIKAMDKLKAEGLIKNLGVSNFSVERFKRAQYYSQNKIAVNQLHYNLVYRESERKGLIDFCQKNDVIFIAFRPIEKGLLAQRGIKVLDAVCQKYNKTPSQVAINWLVSQKNITTISKISDPVHLKESLAALDWQMAEEDIELLKKEIPAHIPELPDHVFPLI